MQFKKINLRPKSLLFKKVNGTSTLVEYKDGIVNKWFLKGLLILSSLYQGRGYNTGIILWSWSQNRDRDRDIREHFKIVVFQNCRRVKSIQIQSFFWSVFSPFRTEYGKIRTKKTLDLVTFTAEILNGELDFLCCVWYLLLRDFWLLWPKFWLYDGTEN